MKISQSRVCKRERGNNQSRKEKNKIQRFFCRFGSKGWLDAKIRKENGGLRWERTRDGNGRYLYG